jgi:hypothetical protein
MERTDSTWRVAPASPGAPGAGRGPQGGAPAGGHGAPAALGAGALGVLSRPGVRSLRAAVWPVLLAALGAALGCWGLALCVYWPVSFAVWGARALPAANAMLTLGIVLAAAGGAALAGGALAHGGAGRPPPPGIPPGAPPGAPHRAPGSPIPPGVS